MIRYLSALALFSFAFGQTEITEPDTTRPLLRCQVGPVVSVVTTSDIVYLGTYGGILILSASDTTAPKKIAEFPVLEIVYGLTFKDGYLYVANGTDGMAIIDLMNPTRPHRTGSIDTPGFTYDIEIANGFAYIADGDSGLMVVDVHTPTKPEYVTTCSLPGRVFSVTLNAGYAYITGLGSGLQVVDIHNPTMPVVVKSYKVSGWTNDVAVSGSHAFLAADYAGLKIINLNDSVETVFDTPGYAYGVAVVNNTAYLADGSGMMIVDVSNPEVPKELGSYPSEGWVRRIWVSGSKAYLAAGKAGLRILDVSNPHSPKEIGFYEIP